MSQSWTSSSYQKHCIQHYMRAEPNSVTRRVQAHGFPKRSLPHAWRIRIHQLNAEFFWSCMPRLHDNLVLADNSQEKISQHHTTGKLVIFHQSSISTPFCFPAWSSPLFLDYFFKRTHDKQAIKKGGTKHWRQELWDWCLEFWPRTSSQVSE